MTRFDDLDRALTAYFDAEAAAPAPDGLLENAMNTTSGRRPRLALHARLHAGGLPSTGSETTRTLLIAAGLIGLLLAIVGAALLGGGRRTPPPLLSDTTVAPSSTPSAPSSAVAGVPLGDAYRATWLTMIPELPLNHSGAGQVSLAISSNGTGLATQNIGPGATFDSTVTDMGDGTIRVVLDRATTGCLAGASGTYRATTTDDGSMLTLVSQRDDCATRQEALARKWARSLTAPTSKGTGYVTTVDPAFRVKLPDVPLSGRTLDDFVEVGDSNGFAFSLFKNPQGFADPCSTTEDRLPYTPGADAFADVLEKNPALKTDRREALTINGHRAVHIIVVGRSDYAKCPDPPDGFYTWTPKACHCHFVSAPGTRDSLYLVEVGQDTFMFEVGSDVADSQLERQVIDSIQIPAHLPGG